jgi:hypothetical protein
MTFGLANLGDVQPCSRRDEARSDEKDGAVTAGEV